MSIKDPDQIASAVTPSAPPARSRCPLFADAIVACIADGREPTMAEIMSIASRICAEARADPASPWASHAARLALAGDCHPAGGLIAISRSRAKRDAVLRPTIISPLIVR